MTGIVALAGRTLVAFGAFTICLYIVINLVYAVIHVAGLFGLRSADRERQWDQPHEPFNSPFCPGIAVIVPAYDEAETIVESLRSLLNLEYPDVEVVLVNDGSRDATLARLRDAYALERVDAEVPFDVPSEPIRDVYRSASHDDLLVIDKENGGKSDALNAGIWLTDQELFCAVDADTIIERSALFDVARPFLEDPGTVVASGGTVRVINGCEVDGGRITATNPPTTLLVGLQSMEYLRAFFSGRMGLDRLRSLVLISGAFGLFRTDVVREIGGYRRDTVAEDFDVVVRMHRHLTDRGRSFRVRFVPDPIAWTEVPETLGGLSRQRRRWYRGLVETMVGNRRMIGNPRYGVVGVFALPFFVVAEVVGPLVEGGGYVILPLAIVVGVLDPGVLPLFLLLTAGFGVLLSWFGIVSEVWTFRRYRGVESTLLLMGYGILENVGYRQWKAFVAWYGLYEYTTGVTDWGGIERSGFGPETSEPERSDPVDAGTASTGASRIEGAVAPEDSTRRIDREPELGRKSDETER